MEKRDPYENFVNWEKKKNSKWSKISKQIKPLHVIGIFLLVFLGQYWVSTGKIQGNYFWGITIAFVMLFVFLMYRETNDPKLIPEHIIKQIVYDALEKKRARGIEIPFDAKVKVTLAGEGVHEQDMASRTSGIIRRDVGFEIIRKGYTKKGVVGVHPFSGIILGIRFEPFGYTGKETKDRVIIPVSVLEK